MTMHDPAQQSVYEANVLLPSGGPSVVQFGEPAPRPVPGELIRGERGTASRLCYGPSRRHARR